MADVAIVLFDRKGQVFAGVELILRDQAVEAFSIVGEKRLAFHADFSEELLAEPAPREGGGCIVTVTQHPGHGSPLHRIIGPPESKLFGLFRKCHISSIVSSTMSAALSGSGNLAASARIHLSTATSLTFRIRAILQKVILPIPYSNNARAFMAKGLPRGWVAVKLSAHC